MYKPLHNISWHWHEFTNIFQFNDKLTSSIVSPFYHKLVNQIRLASCCFYVEGEFPNVYMLLMQNAFNSNFSLLWQMQQSIGGKKMVFKKFSFWDKLVFQTSRDVCLMVLVYLLDFLRCLFVQITAGCDMILMPSRFEPCGLNQLYAMRYGTAPIAHATGGLRDTVIPYNPWEGKLKIKLWIMTELS